MILSVIRLALVSMQVMPSGASARLLSNAVGRRAILSQPFAIGARSDGSISDAAIRSVSAIRGGDGLRSGSAPVDHVVLLKVKPGTSERSVRSMRERLESMVDSVPGVQSVRVGEGFVASWMEDRRRGYTHYIRVQLASRQALRAYQDDEIHKNIVAECIAPIIDGPPLAIDCDAVEVRNEQS